VKITDIVQIYNIYYFLFPALPKGICHSHALAMYYVPLQPTFKAGHPFICCNALIQGIGFAYAVACLRMKSTYVHFVDENLTALDILHAMRKWKAGQVIIFYLE